MGGMKGECHKEPEPQSERGTDTHCVYQVSWPCPLDSKQFRWQTAAFTEADSSSAARLGHTYITLLQKSLMESFTPTTYKMGTKRDRARKEWKTEKRLDYMQRQLRCFDLSAVHHLQRNLIFPYNEYYGIAWLRKYSGEEQSRAELPVTLPFSLSLSFCPSYFHKWIYHFQALTCPPRQDGPASTEPCKLLLTLTMKVFVQITAPVII